MKSNFERYVKNIVSQTECNKEDKEDMYEEFMVHLELSKEDLMRKGLNEKEAELKAMELFGIEEDIGSKMQQSIFPYRKEFMLTLSIVSFIFSISVYLLSLFSEGDAYIGWLICSMFVNSLLLFIPLNQVVSLNRRRWINSLLLLHILTYLYGNGILSAIDSPAQLPLSILNWLIILLALLLVYQTTIYETNFQGDLVKVAKRLHQLNFITGIVTIGYTLFFIWAMMWFGGFQPFMLLMAAPFVLWVVLYVGQMKLLEKHKRVAFTLAVMSILINVLILLWFFYPFL